MPAAEARASVIPGIAQPFPGLRPFESTEEAIFRGRRKQTDELLRRLASHRFLAVVGTSGSGKSSLVRAGLLPALDRGYLAGATSRWRIAVMRPGMAPIENLSEALLKAGIETADTETLSASSLGLVEAVRSAQLDDGESLLVVADQFEELFRYSRRQSADGEAARFVNLLLTASRRPDAPVYVVLTMRSDFLGDCAQFHGLPEALSESQYLIPRLAREERRQAIVEPLRLFGVTMTPQLIEQLLNDSNESDDQPADQLPVLQHALLRTWLEPRTGDTIDIAQYQSAGRMESALNQHAERLFEKELDDPGRKWAERIFRCLTTTELGRPIRRPTPLANLYKIVGAENDQDRKNVDEVLSLFKSPDNSFLQLNKDGSADISHESLIWKWKRLTTWVADEAAAADLYDDLAKDSKGKATWTEPKLSSTIKVRDTNGWNADWAKQYSKASFDDVQAFLKRSQKAVRGQKLLRWAFVLAAIALTIQIPVAYYSWLQARQKERQLAIEQIAFASIAREQKTLKGNLETLNAVKGSTQEERDRIAAEKATIEAQLTKSQQDSQKMAAQAQQSSTDLQTNQTNLKNLQSQLATAQHDRDDAIKARQDAEAKSAQLTKDLAAAQRDRDAALKSLKDAEAKSTPPAKPPEITPATPQVANTSPAAPPKTIINPKDGLTYVWIPPGAFTMGCSPGDKECRADEKPHSEKIPNGFWLGQTEVTQAAWKKVKGNNPSHHKGDELPVEAVLGSEAADYCKVIGGRLPSEAEWEYAARAGSETSRYGDLDAIAWQRGNSNSVTHPVGQKRPNAFSLYDMLGNIAEWTTPPGDPSKWFVERGGSVYSTSDEIRVSFRQESGPSNRFLLIIVNGFRCVGPPDVDTIGKPTASP